MVFTRHETAHWRLTATLALLILHFRAAAPGQTPVDVHWATAANGAWNTASRWTPAVVPNNIGLDHYNAFVDPAGAAYTVTLSSNATIDNFTLNNAAATLQHSSGTLRVLGTANLGQGVYRLAGGTLQGGSWTAAGSVFQVAAGSTNTFDGLMLAGDVRLNATNSFVRVINGLTISAGAMRLTASNARASFEGTQTFSGQMDLQVASPTPVRFDALGNLTLAAGSLIGGAVQIGGTGVVTNSGSITSNVSAATSISPTSFTNSGLVDSAGTGQFTLGATGTQATNAPGGLWRVTSGTLRLAGNWANQGSIELLGGTLILGGAFSTDGLGQIVRTGGAVTFSGVLDNSNRVLTFDTPGGSWNASSSRLIGGTVRFLNGQRLVFGSGQNILENTLVEGNLLLDQSSGGAVLRGTTAVTGDIAVTLGNNLAIDAGTTIDNQIIHITGVGAARPSLSADGTGEATIGPQTHVSAANARLQTNVSIGGTATLVNRGQVSIDQPSTSLEIFAARFRNEGDVSAPSQTTLTIGRTSPLSTWSNVAGGQIVADGSTVSLNGTWTNDALIHARNSTLNLLGDMTLGPNSIIENDNSAIRISGALHNSGTLVFGPQSGVWSMTGGRIIGGTVQVISPEWLAWSSGSLENVHLIGDVNVAQSGSMFLYGSNTLDNTVHVLNGAQLAGNGPGQLAAGTVELRGGTLVGFGTTGSYTLGSNVHVTGSGTVRSNSAAISFINLGAIEAGFSELLTFGTLDNRGTLRAHDGGSIYISPLSDTHFRNSTGGLMIADHSQIHCDGDWRNDGTIRLLNNASLFLAAGPADLTPTQIGQLDRTNSLVLLLGHLQNGGNELVLDENSPASWGALQLFHAQIIGGTVRTVGNTALRVVRLVEGSEDPSYILGAQFQGRITLTGNLVQLYLDAASTFQGTVTIGDGTNVSIAPTLHLACATPVANSTFQLIGGELNFNGLSQRLAQGSEIRGYGRLSGGGGNPRFANYGLIESNQPGRPLFAQIQVDNFGVVRATHGTTMDFTGGSVSRTFNLESGRWEVLENSQIIMGSSLGFWQNFGEVLLSGPSSVIVALSALQANHGRIELRDHNVLNLNSCQNDGAFDLGSGSILHIGTLTQLPAGRVEITLDSQSSAAAPFVRIVVAGQLGGTLHVSVAGDANLRLGDRLTLIHSDEPLAGAFATLELPTLPGMELSILQTANEVIAIVRAARGDLNCDGVVNAFDIQPFVLAITDPVAYRSAFPGCDITWADVNRDGFVNNFDIDQFVECITNGCP